MEEFKDINQISLPIPEYDKDLNLVRFKAIFELLQSVQNDVIFNTELAKEAVMDHDPRIESLETEQSTQRGEIDALEEKTPQSYKPGDTVTFADINLGLEDSVRTTLINAKAELYTLMNRVTQSLTSGSTVYFANLHISSAVTIAGYNVTTRFNSVESDITDLDNNKIDNSFKENFDLDGDF